jgi:hypothetical protein
VWGARLALANFFKCLDNLFDLSSGKIVSARRGCNEWEETAKLSKPARVQRALPRLRTLQHSIDKSA